VIVVVGLSHHTAPLEMREALAFPKERMGEALERLREESGLAEAMILSTCNRVEIYGRAPESAAEPMAEFLARFHVGRR
jgi:glutamyl-tRNA reductase